MDVRLRVPATGRYIATRWMEIWEGPVDQVEVQVIKPQICERLATGSDDVIFAMLVIPQLRSDPQLLALKMTPHYLLECVSNLMFVAVDGCTIEVPIANCRRPFDRGCNFTCRNMVGAEGSRADRWHYGAGIQNSLGHKGWIRVPVNRRSR